MTKKVAVLHVVSGLYPRGGGPSRTVVQLADALANESGIYVSLLSQSRKGDPTTPSRAEGVDRRILESSSWLALKCGLPVLNELARREVWHGLSLIHNHGLWMPVNHWAAWAARRYRLPLVMQPRGMLSPWALNHKGGKKRLAMAFFQRGDLERAQVLIATSAVEYENIRALGFRQPIAVIANGVQLELRAGTALARHGDDERVRTVLFLSRIHPVKGLLNLVHAWSRLRPPGWRLCIAGPDEGGHLSAVLSAVRQEGIEGSVEYLGEVHGYRKSEIYGNTDVFALPTFSENFGVVVAEALAHGLPVITTRGAPWADLKIYNCGWWIDIGIDPLVATLQEAIALSDDERRAMGARGRLYVERYDWGDIARHTADLYRWVLGRGPIPQCVKLD